MHRLAMFPAMLLLIAMFAACGDGSREFSLFVQHYRTECWGPSLRLCYLVREQGASEFGLGYDPIDGFEYEWGFTYELVVEEHPVDEPLADGPSAILVFREVVSREAVPAGTTFQLSLTAGEGRIVEVLRGTFEFYAERRFSCVSSKACNDLRAPVNQGGVIVFEFEHPSQPTAPLILRGWELTPPP